MKAYPMNVFLCIVGLLTSLPGRAQTGLPPVFAISTDTTYFPIDSAHFQLLEDQTGSLTIDQVSQPAFSKRFYYDSYRNDNRSSNVYWLRMRVRNNLAEPVQLFYNDSRSGYSDLYTRTDTSAWTHEQTGYLRPYSQITMHNRVRERGRVFIAIAPGQTVLLYQRSEMAFWQPKRTEIRPGLQTQAARIQEAFTSYQRGGWQSYLFDGMLLGVLFLAAVCNLLIFVSIRDRTYLYFGICLLFIALDRNKQRVQQAFFPEHPYTFSLAANFFFLIYFLFFIQAIRAFIQPGPTLKLLNRLTTLALLLTMGLGILQFATTGISHFPAEALDTVIEVAIRIVYLLALVLSGRMIRQGFAPARTAIIATLPLFVFWMASLLNGLSYEIFDEALFLPDADVFGYIEGACFAWMIIFFSGALVGRYNQFSRQVSHQSLEREQLERERILERNRLIAGQNEQLEQQVRERTAELQTSLDTLKATQAQLIQSEKMASLGELTAGIAHEIQNPLNFVNNFAEVSVELVAELEEEQQKPDRDPDLETDLLGDLKQNLQRISQHGGRASNIVRGMLEHARTSAGQRELTDINALCDEYLRLAYQGLRRTEGRTPGVPPDQVRFTCTLETDFDPDAGRLPVMPQEMGRVVLNLLNNAFYAVQEQQRTAPADYQPTVTIKTRRLDTAVQLTISDNGTGMAESVKQKIFQPFFTTKPTGSGTGLGLSLSYDIITNGHGGTLTVESCAGAGTVFTILLPVA